MKKNCWLILGVMVAVSATAQTSTNSLPPIPPPAIGAAMSAPAPVPAVVKPAAPVTKAAPAKKPVVKPRKKVAAKAAPKKITFTEASASLAPGPAEVCVSNLNVRGQAGLKGEVVAHVQKGETVTVLSQITLDKHTADEPAQWAKIALPASVGVWVRTSYIDATTKTVTPKKLNLRAGPGENYSVLGVVEKGTAVTESGAKGEWTKIEAPASSYAFIAAMYLKQVSSGNVPVNPPASSETPSIPSVPTTVTEVPIVALAPTTTPAGPEMNLALPPVVNPQVIIQTNIIVMVETNVPPPPPRIVTHEGTVRSSVSPVAPTYYELYDPASGTAINYLFSTTTNLNLARYSGMHINVTGEEGLDARWHDTPVLTVQKIYVLSANAPAPAPVAATADKSKKSKPWYHLWLW